MADPRPGRPPRDLPRLAQITGPWAHRFAAFDAELDAHHLAGTEHHHLAILAVRPDRQGQGIGTALLDAHHTDLDQKGITAYLEASDERTRRIYLRHGYTDYGTAIRLHDGLLAGDTRDTAGQPTDGSRMYPMVRIPRSGTRGESARRKAK
jgi:GNAT superfamily N-acetyltransferase